MRKKSRKGMSSNQQQIQISYIKQNKQLSLQQNRLNVQILRVHTIQKQRMIVAIFQYQQQKLCQFFQSYQLFPYNDTFNIIQLIDSNKLKLIKNQDKIYFGQVQKKQRAGKGINISKDGKVYEGEFERNQKNGFGIEIYPNGNLYIGEFQNNKKHGNGKFFWFSLSSKNPKQDQFVQYYEGIWWGGLPDGEGMHQKINGDFYTGHFKNGLKHSQGQQYFSNGDYYKGEYVNGLPQGYGQYTWNDKSYYKGDFKQGLRNGYGLWGSGEDQNQIYKGHYCMDKKSGYGVYQWGNGWVYKGNFDNDFRNGFGELYNGNKLAYRGFWENGEQTDKEIGNIRDFGSKSTTIKRNQSSDIYNRTIGSAQRTNKNNNSKFGSNINNNNPQTPQRYNQPSRIRQCCKNRKKHNNNNNEQQCNKDFGTIHHQGDYIMRIRPQSFKSTITSFNNRRTSLTDRKGLKSTITGESRKSFMKNNDNTIGTSISKPLNRNYGNLYVPQGYHQQCTRYANRNYI